MKTFKCIKALSVNWKGLMPIQRQIQTGGRVDLPDEILDSAGLSHRDRVLVGESDGKVVLVPNDSVEIDDPLEGDGND